jgi:hypothetical protein
MLLLENPIPIYFVGAVLMLITGLTFLVRRNLKSLLWLAGMVSATVLMLAVERLVVTEREQVEANLAMLLESLRENDMSGLLALIDPAAAEVRADVEAMMPEATIKDTGATMVHIDLEGSRDHPAATAQFLGRVDGIHKRSGQRVFYLDEVRLRWRKRDDRWLVEDYTAMWRGRPINAVQSMRANRPTTQGGP